MIHFRFRDKNNGRFSLSFFRRHHRMNQTIERQSENGPVNSRLSEIETACHISPDNKAASSHQAMEQGQDSEETPPVLRPDQNHLDYQQPSVQDRLYELRYDLERHLSLIHISEP